MANYTAHYHLHQWEPEDSFLRGDFNEDFQKIDAGLAGRGDCSLLFGSYVGPVRAYRTYTGDSSQGALGKLRFMPRCLSEGEHAGG